MADQILEDTIEAWVDDSTQRLGLSPYNSRRSGDMVLRYLRAAGIKRLDDVRAPGLMKWLAGEAGRVKPRTVRNQLAAIRQWGRFLHASGWTEHSPFESVKVRRCVSDDGCKPIDASVAMRLVTAAKRRVVDASPGSPKARALTKLVAYLLMLDCGLRVGEVRSQRWDDIDLQRRVVKVTHDKAGRNDTVPMSRKTAAALRLLRRCLCIHAGEPVGGRVMAFGGPNAKTMQADLKAAGASGPGRFHRLRKYAITSRAEAGWGIWDLATFARHRDPKTTSRYVALDPTRIGAGKQK